MTGIPDHCTRCGLPLDPRNITGICLECKHIARDAAAGYTAEEVDLDEARANFVAVFRNQYRPVDADALYMRGACRRCGRFRARRDTGCCEWCSGPRRFKRKKPAKAKGGASTFIPPKDTTVPHNKSTYNVSRLTGQGTRRDYTLALRMRSVLRFFQRHARLGLKCPAPNVQRAEHLQRGQNLAPARSFSLPGNPSRTSVAAVMR